MSHLCTDSHSRTVIYSYIFQGLFLASLWVLSSCVYTSSSAVESVDDLDIKPEDVFTRDEQAGWKADFLILRPQLRREQNRALKYFTDRGYLPVYVRAMNTEQVALASSSLQFRLVHEGQDGLGTAPVRPEDLPKEFQDFHWKALTANIYNTAVVLTSVGAICIVIAALEGGRGSGCGNLFAHTVVDLWRVNRDVPESPRGSKFIYNDLTRSTSIDFQGHLFQPSLIAPNQVAEGLIFFSLSKEERRGSLDGLSVNLLKENQK